jgi:branched-chain amino acid transport system ATP-binding protein
MPLLEVQNVRRSFGGMVAVDDVSFSVNQGRIKAVIGPNGAGKTTLFNIISGLLPSETGQVLFKNKRISGLKPFQIARAGISRTFQTPSLFLQMNVLENVMVGQHCRTSREFVSCCFRSPGQRREERAIRVAAVEQLDYVGLSALSNDSAGSLAFGQRRMVELARSLATQPDLLLLDEPASGLNTRETAGLAQMIRKIRDRGITVLLVEHDMSLVMDVSDEVLVLHNGRAICEGPPQQVQNDPNVISVYLGAGLEDVTPGKKSKVRL